MPLSPAIAEALATGSTILTSNQRAARSLHRAWDATQHAAGKTLWPTPKILDFDTWTHTLYHQLLLSGHATRLLLNASQLLSIWRDILAKDPAISGLRSLDRLSELAADSWNLLAQHQGLSRLRECNVSTDTRAFLRWATEFDRRLTRDSFLAPAALPAALTAALATGALDLPTPLVLVDFHHLTPARANLISSIEQAGYTVSRLRSAPPAAAPTLLTALSDTDELAHAAHWARQQLAANPAASIAIVVPALAQRRGSLERAFTAILPPATFEFSLGIPLSETALIATALTLLDWLRGPLALTHISALLLSPFFGGITPKETAAIAEFDAFELRTTRLLEPQLSLQSFLALIHASPRASRLANLVLRLKSLLNAPLPTSPLSHADHMDAVRATLAQTGWTASAARSSVTFQAHRRFETALDEVAALDAITPQFPSPQQALQTLTRILRHTIFAPESTAAPIQILGPLELGGVPFDALCFLAADDLSWPIPSSPSPLLPFALQRELQIPGTDPTHDRLVDQRLTQRILASAPQVLFSFAAHSEDGARRPAALITALAPAPHVAVPLPAPVPIPYILVADTVPITPLPDQVTSGGYRILELQAACGFRAFAELRLFSSALESPDAGFDPRTSGTIVHQVMEHFWRATQTRANLLALTSQARYTLLDTCISTALTKASPHAQTIWTGAYLEVQRQRLHTLLTPWLDLEAKRADFAVRDSELKVKDFHLGPLRLDLVVDRIDDTAQGLVIIDYKTGEAAPRQWISARPEAPQLPLYAVYAQNQGVAAVAFAQLRAGEGMKFIGFTDDPTLLREKPSRMPGVATFQDQITLWHQTLTHLAEDFVAGQAAVSPRDYPETCKHCHQRILCRLDPSTLEDDTDEEAPAP